MGLKIDSISQLKIGTCKSLSVIFLLICSFFVTIATSQNGRTDVALTKPSVGKASWYGRPFHGRKTANGEVYDMYKYTAASKTLPFHTCLLVTLRNKSVYVRITDRGPYVEGREIDLSMGAAEKIGLIGQGTGVVTIKNLGKDKNCEQRNWSQAK
jgi:rare lipoprotein A (peptidoglycan hydrolase)